MTAGLVVDPAKHIWSEQREIIGKRGFGLLDLDDVVIMFGGGRKVARRAFVRTLKSTGDRSLGRRGTGQVALVAEETG